MLEVARCKEGKHLGETGCISNGESDDAIAKQTNFGKDRFSLTFWHEAWSEVETLNPTGELMLNEFKKFILKGNVVDLSTGVIIGAAFGGIVTAFTKGIVEPILRLIPSGGENIKGLAWEIGGMFKDDKGNLVPNMIDLNVIVNASINFLITAAVVFFVIIKPLNKLMSMIKKEEAAGPPADVVLLTEIRDLLKKQN